MISNSINFKIFRENKALFDQIVVIFDQIAVIFDQIVVIYQLMCKQIVYKKILLFSHYLYQFDSNYIKLSQTKRILLLPN
jgi:hypothetical protein